MRVPALAMALLAGCLGCGGAQAQVAPCLQSCIAEAADLDRLPAAFAGAGLVEVLLGVDWLSRNHPEQVPGGPGTRRDMPG